MTTSAKNMHRINANARELQDMKDKLQGDVAEMLAIFEHDTGLTVDGVYLKREPTTVGVKHGAINAVSIEVLL